MLISHDGGFRTGFSSSINIYPEDHVCIIVLCNRHAASIYDLPKDIVGLFNPNYARASRMDSVADPDTARTGLLKSFYETLGLQVDTARKIARELHMTYYPDNEEDLDPFRNLTEFTFIKAIHPVKPQKNIFGDLIQDIILYKIKTRDMTDPHYVSFFLDPAGKVVFMDFEE